MKTLFLVFVMATLAIFNSCQEKEEEYGPMDSPPRYHLGFSIYFKNVDPTNGTRIEIKNIDDILPKPKIYGDIKKNMKVINGTYI